LIGLGEPLEPLPSFPGETTQATDCTGNVKRGLHSACVDVGTALPPYRAVLEESRGTSAWNIRQELIHQDQVLDFKLTANSYAILLKSGIPWREACVSVSRCTESYRIARLFPMRQRISDTQIHTAIASLLGTNPQWADGTPSVREVARCLHSMHGRRGSTDRIRLALKHHRDGSATTAASVDLAPIIMEWKGRIESLVDQLDQSNRKAQEAIADLQIRLQAAEERARRAEERELAHQDHWAEKVYELREKLKDSLSRQPKGVTPDQYLAVHRELKAAREEIALLTSELEQRSR
jgi:hypothetical protein